MLVTRPVKLKVIVTEEFKKEYKVVDVDGARVSFLEA